MEIFKILGTIALNGMDEFKKQTDSASSMGKKLAGVMGKGVAAAAKIGAAATGAAATGLAVLTKNALDSVGELQQNMGGAEAVFAEYADSMVSKAAEAYNKMGLSQSDYLATANKMGALFQGSGFGIEESANMSSEAMQRAADVASIMGLDVSAAMEAVAGAAKGNFTMMDNLGVAINDTTLQIYAQEKGLGELETTQDKVAAAMQMFMEKTEYAAGNYAAENETLAGSLTTLKAAWSNWLSGAGDTDQLADSVLNAADVIIDSLGTILPRLTGGISALVSKLAPQLPGMIQTLLPNIIMAITTLVTELASQLPAILEIILPVIVETAPEIINTLVTTLVQSLPTIIAFALQLIVALAQGVSESLPTLIPTIIQVLGTIVQTLLQNIDLIIMAGVQLVAGLFQGLWNELVAESAYLGEWVQQNLISPIENKFADFLNVGKNVINKVWEGMKSAWTSVTSWFTGVWNSLFSRSARVTSDGQGNVTMTPAKNGLDYVPYDEFPALLHKGEAVLTAEEASAWRAGKNSASDTANSQKPQGSGGSGFTINQYISAVPQTPVQLASATAAYFEQARWSI